MQLRKYPFIGRPVPEFQNMGLSYLIEVIYNGYRVIYNPASSEKITIIAVVSGRMILPEGIKAEWDIQ